MNCLQAWQCLREHGPLTPRALAALCGVNRKCAGQVMRRLMRKGSARRNVGASWHVVYRATNKMPVDGRGKHAEVSMNLAKGRVLGLAAIAASRGRLYTPKPVHPLDKAMRCKSNQQ